MANEVTLNGTLAYQDARMTASDTLQVVNFLYSVTTSTPQRMQQQITTSAVAIALGNIATLGWCMFVNRDTTNYIDLLTATNGTKIARIWPNGGFAIFYVGTGVTAPAGQANTASCWMEYFLTNA